MAKIWSSVSLPGLFSKVSPRPSRSPGRVQSVMGFDAAHGSFVGSIFILEDLCNIQ